MSHSGAIFFALALERVFGRRDSTVLEILLLFYIPEFGIFNSKVLTKNQFPDGKDLGSFPYQSAHYQQTSWSYGITAQILRLQCNVRFSCIGYFYAIWSVLDEQDLPLKPMDEKYKSSVHIYIDRTGDGDFYFQG